MLRPGISFVEGDDGASSGSTAGGFDAGGIPVPGRTIGVDSAFGDEISSDGVSGAAVGFLVGRGFGAGFADDGGDALDERGLAGCSPSGVSGVSLERLGLRGLAGGSKITSGGLLVIVLILRLHGFLSSARCLSAILLVPIAQVSQRALLTARGAPDTDFLPMA